LADAVPTFHPEPETLLGYAAGSLDEASSVLVATHLALCPRCRAEVRRLETVGGALTGSLEPVALAPDALAAVLARLDEPEAPARRPAGPAFDRETLFSVPAPLRDYLGGNLSSLPWRWRGPSIRELPLAIGDGGPRASLIRVRPGTALPAHTHTGAETTLVLCGAFVDDGQSFARGDVSIATSDDDHQPVATPDAECLCFAVVDGPLRLTGPIGRLFNPFLRL
jgi:putative transcriptional regulator